MKKHLLITVVLLMSFSFAHGQSKYSNEFLSLGIGARGLAMGNTMCAIPTM